MGICAQNPSRKGPLLLPGGGLSQGKAHLFQGQELELSHGRSSWLERALRINCSGLMGFGHLCIVYILYVWSS